MSAPLLTLMTRPGASRSAELLRGELALRNIDVALATELPAQPASIIFVRVDRPTQLELQRAARRRKHIVLNPSRPRWGILRRLIRAGIDVPRSEPARTLARGLRCAERIGFPCVLKDNTSALTLRFAANPRELALAWRPGERTIVQEYVYRGAEALRITVIGGRCAYATNHFASDGFCADRRAPHEPAAEIPGDARELALRAATAVGLSICVVTLVRVDGGHTVIGVSPKLWGPAGVLADHLASLEPSVERIKPRPRRSPSFTVAVTCPDRRIRHPVWLWVPLLRALRGAGHRVVEVRGAADRSKLDDARFILLDPARTLRASEGDASWMNYLYDQHRARAHYSKRVDGGRLVSITGKRDTAALVADLGIDHPRTFLETIPEDAKYPLIAKPNVSSCGRGIRIFRAPGEVPNVLRRRIPRSWVVQELLRPDREHAVSMRIVTVKNSLVAAGIYYGRGAVSNLNRGGRAIPLSGAHRNSRLSGSEYRLLEHLGLEPEHRAPPPAVASVALAVSRWYSERGVQILGHDFIPNLNGGWCYLESNAYPGYLLFAETDGDRRRRLLSGYYRAARLVAGAIGEQFGS